jgi:transketolase
MVDLTSENINNIDLLCINTIRSLAMDAVQKANSGHPGAPMGLAPAAYTLWTRILKHNPANPGWFNRDRFILSGGHASMLLYSMLFLTGYDLSLEDIKNFRQLDSKTPGHPEYRHTPGVETTTGPLGQGFANGVGMAMAERHLAASYNTKEHEIIDHHTFVICGDGDLMEGITSEAASLAGHLGLSKLICVYDDNKISIEGSTGITFTEDVAERFKAYKWNVIKVDDGNDSDAIFKALKKAKAEKKRPTIIMLRTHIAYGSPNKQDSAEAHGAPLGEEEIRLTKKNLSCPGDSPFYVLDEVLQFCRSCIETGKKAEKKWLRKFKAYQKESPGLAEKLADAITGKLPEGWENSLPVFSSEDGSIATRAASGKALNAIAEKVTNLMGGSADLAPSNNTIIKKSCDFQKESYHGRNIRFGVREHAMGAIMSGMALHGGIRPYGGTFLVFADYMRSSIRLAALMKIPVIYVFTHDSIAVGEDGPTHQPVEHLSSLRAIPGLTVIRPADANETSEAWRFAVKNTEGPVALILSRQNLPVIEKRPDAENLFRNGAYIVSDSGSDPSFIIIATGSEVHIAVEAAKILTEKGISARVVSMPSMELFEKALPEYRERLLPSGIKNRIVVEAGIRMGWERYTGEKGEFIGMTGFGASAPGGTLMKKFGFTSGNIVQKALKLLQK